MNDVREFWHDSLSVLKTNQPTCPRIDEVSCWEWTYRNVVGPQN